jgi:hypothetical protein
MATASERGWEFQTVFTNGGGSGATVAAMLTVKSLFGQVTS